MSENATQTCARHPKEVTYLRCAACNTPICDRCAVLTPVGYKCKACTASRDALYTPSAPQLVAGTLVALAAGALGGALLSSIGFFGIWLALIAGRFVGTLILKATGGKGGLVLEILAGVGIVAGGLAPSAALLLASPAPLKSLLFSSGLYLAGIYPLIIVAVLAASAVSRLRWSWSYWGL